MVGRMLIPDASGPVAPASTGRTGGPKIIWAKQSSAPGMSFAPASHVQRALQSKPSAAPNPQRDDPVAGFFRKIGEFFSPNKPRPEQAEQRGRAVGYSKPMLPGTLAGVGAVQRGRAVGDSNPMLPGALAGIGGVQKAGADKKAEEQRLAEAAQNEQEARARARSSGAGSTSSIRQMTMDEYNALDSRSRAAIDFNGLLQNSLSKDTGLTALDKDGSGRVTLGEAEGSAKDLAGYRTAYKRIYGRDADNNTTYSPNTLGLLNSLKLTDTASLDEYLNGTGYVTMSDLKRGSANEPVAGTANTPGRSDRTERDKLVSGIASGMTQLQEALNAGRVSLSGGGVSVGLSADRTNDGQRSQFVDALRSSLMREDAPTSLQLTGQNDRFDAENGISLLGMVDQGTQQRYSAMNEELTRQLAQGASANELRDKNLLRAAGFENSGFDLDEWVDYVSSREADASGSGTTLEQSLMSQLGPSGGNR